jgi:hypothetical protein
VNEFLLVVVVVLAAGFLLVAAFALRTLGRLRREISELNKSVGILRSQLDDQAGRVAQLAAFLDRRRNDPAYAIVDSLREIKSRGLVGTALLVGVRLFRSYLGGRPRRKALPP